MEFFNSIMQSLIALAVGAATWITLLVSGVGLELPVRLQPASTQELATTTHPTSTRAATSDAATTTPAKQTAPSTPKKTAQAKKVINPVPEPPSPPPAPAEITNDMIVQTNALARSSLVNVLCTFRTAQTASYISGSGLMIDPRGVVLTNAHVAQYFLLQDYPLPGSSSCMIRTGGPATPAYQATLLYLPPAWVDAHASQITSSQASGTGERDYAFLYITGPTQFAPALPSSFASLPYSTEFPQTNDPVLLAGYPAGFLTGTDIQRNLYVSTAVSKIGQLYTFNSATKVDLVSLGGTAVSQSGSSGGGVINLVSNKLVGLIATESPGATTAERDLRAVTFAHINESLVVDGKGGISGLLSGDLLTKANAFKTSVAPALTQKLITEIEN